MDTDHRAPSPAIGWTRLAIGLGQGLLLFLLHKTADQTPRVWPASEPALFAALTLMTAFVPLPVMAAIGTMKRLNLLIWSVVGAVAVAAFAATDLLRGTQFGGDLGRTGLAPEPQTIVFAAVFLFIGHHLVEPADAHGKLIAPYPAYYDTASKRGVQLTLAVGFTGAFWLLLFLGAALFKLIGLDFLQRLITKDWFGFPVSGLVFASAVHLTDVRVGLIRGIRTVALTLLSWLLPVMGLIAIGFLAALPFTGLELLWKTGHAGALLLSAAGALIILINAAYQDGGVEHGTPLILRWAVRATSLALPVLVAIAGYGLALRVGQHGLTPDRIIAMACALVGACYAVGYAVAAVLPGVWMKLLETVNVLTAGVILVVIAALFTPIADPARLSVNDQMRRLERGKVTPDKFDFAFLRFESGRYGRDALKALQGRKTGPNAAEIARRAAEAAKATDRWASAAGKPTPVLDVKQVTVYPKGAALPAGFLASGQAEFRDACGRVGANACEAFLIDLDGDGKDEVLMNWGYRLEAYAETAQGGWEEIGGLPSCGPLLDGLRQGKAKTVTPRWRDLEVLGQRARLGGRGGCEADPVEAVTVAKKP